MLVFAASDLLAGFRKVVWVQEERGGKRRMEGNWKKESEK